MGDPDQGGLGWGSERSVDPPWVSGFRVLVNLGFSVLGFRVLSIPFSGFRA